jgi:hypothetical protein
MDQSSVRQPSQLAQSIVRLSSVGIILTALWAVVSPASFALDFSADSTALWSSIAMGIVALLAASLVLLYAVEAVSGFLIAGVAGLWGIAAPYILEFNATTEDTAALNSIIVGIVLLGASIVGVAAALEVETEQH